MAVQNLTASALTYVQERLTNLFAAQQSTPARYPWVNHVATAQAMGREHMAMTSEVMDAQNNCIGYRVYWLTKGDTTIAYNSTPGSYTFNCTIPSGQGPVSNEKIYTNNFAIVARIEVDDDICGNVFRGQSGTYAQQAGDLIANRFDAALKDIRDAWNTKLINFLDTNKTPVNNDSNLPTGLAFAASTFTVTESTLSMQEPDTLTDLDALAVNNDLGGYFYIAGRNHFYNAKVNAGFRVNNDAERDHVRLLEGNGWRMYHDIKNLDSTLSGRNSFIVDPGSYVIWDFVNKERTRNPVMIEDNKWEYFITDPVLSLNGRPMRVNVRYQKTCNGGNLTQMRDTYTHRWELIFHGGLYVAPASEDTHTGILKIKSA